MKREQLHDELTIVGAIFILIIGIGMYLKDTYSQNLKIAQLEKDYYVAKKIVVELDSTTKEMQLSMSDIIRAYDTMRDDLNEVQTLMKIKEDLRGYSIEEKAIGLAIAWTESTWNFNANHKDGGRTVGICGVLPEYWDEYLTERDIPINSVAACIEIYNFYKEENNGSREKAIKEYKGIQNNTYLINKTIKLKDKILKILKENK